MKRSRLVQLLKAGSPLVAFLTVAPLIVVILGLAACVKYPVGDPEKSKVDPRYSGVWSTKEADGDSTLLFLRPYDSRTYFASIFTYRHQSGGIEPTKRDHYKAWLAPIGGATFMTMEPLSCAHFAGVSEKPLYLVSKISLADGALGLRLVNGAEEPAKSANNSRELEAVIEKHVHSDSLYAGQAIVFKQAGDKALIKSVLEAFGPKGGEEP